MFNGGVVAAYRFDNAAFVDKQWHTVDESKIIVFCSVATIRLIVERKKSVTLRNGPTRNYAAVRLMYLHPYRFFTQEPANIPLRFHKSTIDNHSNKKYCYY